MTIQQLRRAEPTPMDHAEQRRHLAAALRLAVRHGWHESVANHFSLALDAEGKRFLMNPNMKHFSRVRASDLLLLDADDPSTMDRPDAPDATAWGLHGSVHRHCRHARCVLHVHPIYSTVLASLADSILPPIDQNSAAFFRRHVVDGGFGGMAFKEEGERCARLLADPKDKVMVMGNHGLLVLGHSVADAFNRLYYFERSAETYVKALSTGRPLRVLSDEIAERTARQWEEYGPFADHHFGELLALLDRDEPDYRD